mgnify:CR=1 FL=1
MKEKHAKNTSWIPEYIEHLVDRYFGSCGLVDDVKKEFRNLPKTELSRWLGANEDFWRKHLIESGRASKRQLRDR